MRLTILLVLPILFFSCGKKSATPAATPTDISGSFVFKGEARTYTVHLPQAYFARTGQLPLVLALHGGFGSASQMARLTNLNTTADTAGFIVVYPDGLDNPSGAKTWNAGNCCGVNASLKNTDDVGFIAALIDTLGNRYGINKKRVYATGHSNGAMMCYRLASELSGKIAAIAPNAGAFQMKTPYNPSRNVPVLHIHSKLDQNAKYAGGKSQNYTLTGLDNAPVDSCLNVVAAKAGCIANKQTIATFPLYTIYRWNGCTAADFQVLLYLTEDGGHSWPGGNQSTGLDTDVTSKAFSNNNIIWSFFSQYSLP
ncbi:polyhydroxybutyrate depolymerase [Chitinophaga jiangningensis]|uniref:Polyhydroxybutyrate depolymerase n=1 Tax=Chitinophaga jiangningensis TaxID=1419482 RepID=A0A1M7K413_9BACT|nr:PHB depolymerase family esterase [Chitinophaga jiangningensis]SHM60029.1 polyhydroxybutyrate depolymerase [Chitinophaga jiangningensis]